MMSSSGWTVAQRIYPLCQLHKYEGNRNSRTERNELFYARLVLLGFYFKAKYSLYVTE